MSKLVLCHKGQQEAFANSEDLTEMDHYDPSHQDLHCLPSK